MSGDLYENVVSKKRNRVVCRNGTGQDVKSQAARQLSRWMDLGRASGIGARSAFPIRRLSVMELAVSEPRENCGELGSASSSLQHASLKYR